MDPLTIQSKYPNGKCKKCGKTWGKDTTLYGIQTTATKEDGSAVLRWCIDQNCGPLQDGNAPAMPTQTQQAPQQQPQQTPQIDNTVPIPDPPEEITKVIRAQTLEIMQVRKIANQVICQFENNPNPAMIGQVVGLIWTQCKNKGVKRVD